MFRYALSRILQTFFVLIGVSLIVFTILHSIPGDPVKLMLGPRAGADTAAALSQQLGLDRPLYQQYFSFTKNLLTGDLGTSYRFKEPVAALLMEALPKTFILAFLAMIVESLLALIAAIISYLSKRSFIDTFFTVCSIFLLSVPVFWLGMLMQYTFSLKLNWLPLSGYDSLFSLIMPVLALALISTAVILRILRVSLKETQKTDYVLLARAKGLSRRDVLLKHQLKNALIPTITYIGIDFGLLMTGAISTEVVFNWPGVGMLMYRAVMQRDIPVILSGVLVLVFIYVLVNLIVDLVYGYFNPAIRGER